jgi:hypothetical protein
MIPLITGIIYLLFAWIHVNSIDVFMYNVILSHSYELLQSGSNS